MVEGTWGHNLLFFFGGRDGMNPIQSRSSQTLRWPHVLQQATRNEDSRSKQRRELQRGFAIVPWSRLM